MADFPLKRALGTHQYKAPPPGARAATRPAAGAGNASGATRQVVVDPTTGEEFETIEGVAEDGGADYAASADFASGVVPPPPEGDEASLSDAEADASAAAQARSRGEDVLTAALANAEEEATKKKLPPLSEVLPSIPAAIQEAVDEIFRAKWTRVTRVKKRDLFIE